MGGRGLEARSWQCWRQRNRVRRKLLFGLKIGRRKGEGSISHLMVRCRDGVFYRWKASPSTRKQVSVFVV